MSTSDTEADLAALERDGYVVIPRLLDGDEITAIREALAEPLDVGSSGRNNFEGHLTQRIYSLIAVAPVFERLALHPRILALCDRLLEVNYLLTASQAIRILPGETSQPLHSDDLFYRIARPRRAVSVSTIFAIDEFNEVNGATEVIAGSHLWTDAEIARLLATIDFGTRRDGQPSEPEIHAAVAPQLKPVLMPAGSVIFFLGTLVHRGGPNRSDRPRLALSNQYCEPWARQQENFQLAISPQQASRMPERLQELMGYSVHPPFMGHIRGLHPKRYLKVEDKS